MNVIGERLRTLRESVQLSQTKLAGLIGTTQTSINRIETGKTAPSAKILLWYADYFHVSLDYIFGRTDNPQGELYDYQPEAIREKAEQNEELEQFIEMCFAPDSPMNAKLKQALIKLIKEEEK